MNDSQNTGADRERAHEFTIELNATPEQVWAAVTEAGEIVKWFAPEAQVEPGLGGKISLSWGPGMEGSSEITAWKPGEHLGTRMPAGSPDADPPRHQSVDYFIEAAGGTTKLRLVHSGFSAEAKFDDEYESTYHGWLTFLAMLRYAVEKKAGVPAVTCFENIFVKVPREEVWRRVIGSEGLALEGTPLEEDSAYRARFAGRDISGHLARFNAGRSFCLVADELGGSALSFFCEKCQGNGMLTVQAVLYGDSATDRDRFAGEVKQFCDAIFPADERISFG